MAITSWIFLVRIDREGAGIFLRDIRSSRSVVRFIREMPRDDRVGVIIGTNERAPYVYAALANRISALAVETDDVNSVGHQSASALSNPLSRVLSHMTRSRIPP